MKLKIYGQNSVLWQWDTGQFLEVEAEEDVQEVHFAMKGETECPVVQIRQMEGLRLVAIPNLILQKPGRFTAYLYCQTEDNSQTLWAEHFYVCPRPKPDSYVYTQNQVLNYSSLDRRLTELEENNTAVKTVNGIVPDENGNVQIDADLKSAVISVNGKTGMVQLSAEDVGALPSTVVIPKLPDALPNPHTLSFTGAVRATYDGSKEISVEIPNGGGTGGGGVTPYYKVASMTTEEEVKEILIPLSADAIAKLNAAEAWILEIYLDVSGSTNTDATMGKLTADMHTTWSTNVFFRDLENAVPTTTIAYAGKIYITAIYRKRINGGASSVLVHKFNSNYGSPSGETKIYGTGQDLTSEKLRVIGSVNLPVGTKIILYAIGEVEVVEI